MAFIQDLVFLLIAVVPGLEARAATLYYICVNNIWLIPFAVIVNFIAILIFIRLIDTAKIPNKIESFLEKRAKKQIHRIERWFKYYGNYAVFLLVALPSTGIGSFTGAFIGRVFGLKGWSFYISIFIGIIISIIPVILLLYGISFLGVGCKV